MPSTVCFISTVLQHLIDSETANKNNYIADSGYVGSKIQVWKSIENVDTVVFSVYTGWTKTVNPQMLYT